MPRSLASGPYTAAEVREVLLSGHGIVEPQFELCDTEGHALDELQGVLAASVGFDTTQEVMGSLRLELIAQDRLLDALFRYHVKPYLCVGPMRGGGIARFGMGEYVMTKPARSLDPAVADGDVMELVLGDLQTYLVTASPGLDPVAVAEGANVAQSAQQVLERVGLGGRALVTPSDDEFAEALSFDVRRGARRRRRRSEKKMQKLIRNYQQKLRRFQRAKQQAARFGARPKGHRPRRPRQYTWKPLDDVTGLYFNDILDEFAAGIGYNPVHMDLDGNVVFNPARNLATGTTPDHEYRTDPSRGVFLDDIQFDSDTSTLANRIVVLATSARNKTKVGTANLDDLIPGHPISKAVIHRDLDVDPVQDDTAATQDARDRRAQRELYDRATFYETAALDVMADPSHGAFDITGVQVDDDPVVGTPTAYDELDWGIDLFDGRMELGLKRLYPAAIL